MQNWRNRDDINRTGQQEQVSSYVHEEDELVLALFLQQWIPSTPRRDRAKEIRALENIIKTNPWLMPPPAYLKQEPIQKT